MQQIPNDRLAYEIASSLNDFDALPLYTTFAEKYSHDFLRRMLNKAMSIPDHKIKRTRGALFTFLVHQSHARGSYRSQSQ